MNQRHALRSDDARLQKIDELAADIEHQVDQVISGSNPSATIGGVTYTPFDLFECIFFNQDEETLRLLMAYNQATRTKIIRDWCYNKAEQLI